MLKIFKYPKTVKIVNNPVPIKLNKTCENATLLLSNPPEIDIIIAVKAVPILLP